MAGNDETDPNDIRLITLKEVLVLLGNPSRMFVIRKELDGDFPHKVHIGGNSIRYWRHEILAWMRRQPRGPRARGTGNAPSAPSTTEPLKWLMAA
jgi:predicted DNA-binding transcriptional regulator AlpA